jgi:putative membrane protein
VVMAAVLSAIHVLTLGLGLGSIFARGRALSRPLDDAGSKRLLAADNVWGLAALLWIASGFARVFLGGKEPTFYWRNGFFWVKLGLFATLFALELMPMITFIRVRLARTRGAALPQFSIETFRRLNALETALIVVIVFVARRGLVHDREASRGGQQDAVMFKCGTNGLVRVLDNNFPINALRGTKTATTFAELAEHLRSIDDYHWVDLYVGTHVPKGDVDLAELHSRVVSCFDAWLK